MTETGHTDERSNASARRTRVVDDLRQDLRFAVRGLGRNRAFSLVAALTIAIGVGATTAVVSVANAILLRPLPVLEPDRLVSIWEVRNGSVSTSLEGMQLPYERVEAYERATSEIFTHFAAHRYANVSLGTGGQAIPVSAVLATGDYFRLLGINAAAGRLFAEDDEPAVVIGWSLWRNRFGGDPGVIGRTVYVDSRPFVVAGVAPRDFGGTAFPLVAELWVPYGAYQQGAALTGHASWLVPIARLRAGLDAARASEQLNAIAERIPTPEGTQVQGARVEPLALRGDSMPYIAGFIGMLLGTGIVVLLIGSANIAGMLIARAIGRRREVAVRLALGASRGRLTRQLVTETLLLFIIGGAGGVLLAFWLTRLMASFSFAVNTGVVALDAQPDASVLLFGITLALITGIAFGFGPALRASRLDLATTLKEGPGATGGRVGARRNAFVTVQLALAVLLLVTAGLFVRTVRIGAAVDPGFDPDGVFIAATNLAPHGYDEARARTFFDNLLAEVRSDPDVAGASLARLALLTGETSGNDVSDAEPASGDARRTGAAWNVVDTAYFGLMRIPLVAGRQFNSDDRAGAAPVAIVNETLARRLWPDQNPIGRRLREGSNVYEVVGVTRNGKYVFMAEEERAFAFLPAAQHFRARMTLHVRVNGEAAEAQRIVESAVHTLDPNVAVESARPLEDAVAISLLPQRFAAILTGIFGGAGLLLSAIGVYGVLAVHVAQRRREFGIRIALGARAGNVLRLVLGHGMILAAAGAAIGLLLASAVTRFVRAFLFGVSPLDPLTFAGVPLLLLSVAVIASFIPARRATRADPLETLRQE